MGTYSFIKQIGRGGFGKVDEVEDEDGIRLARKTFLPSGYFAPTDLEKLKTRFKREVKTQGQLGGNEIIPVLDSDLSGDAPWFIMPLADSSYDKQIVTDKANKSVDIQAIADILGGLDFLHRLGYTHRDLNPKNILLHNGTWKLSDLGAVLPPTGQTVTLTEDTIIYTERYCSPEQRKLFHSAQPPADIYSFGCILHDIFGHTTRTPYGQASAKGTIGIVIEKCTDPKPSKRPKVGVLQDIVLEELVDMGGHFEVTDEKANEWLERLKDLDNWGDQDFEDFARFFYELDLNERNFGFEDDYVNSLSTPFLARIPLEPWTAITKRKDGMSAAICEKYCEWVRTTSFRFGYADKVCNRLTAIVKFGAPADRAMAVVALLELGSSHNRWYVMRRVLEHLSDDQFAADARRFAIEIKTEEAVYALNNCISVVKWDTKRLTKELNDLLKS